MKCFLRFKVLFAAVFLLSTFAVSATKPSYRIDSSYQSPNQDNRIKTLVIGYTATELEPALAIFMNKNTERSVNYLVPNTRIETHDEFTIYKLVDEDRRPWCVGVSCWGSGKNINASSIGLWAVNLGFPADDNDKPLMERRWYSYPKPQIQAIGELAQTIALSRNIAPENVLGHGDAAPGRMFAPGPLFPWKELHEKYHVGAWPDDAEVKINIEKHTSDNINIVELQKGFAIWGYKEIPQSGVLDDRTKNVVSAFQMHFRSKKYDGVPDVETVAILKALIKKYKSDPQQ